MIEDEGLLEIKHANDANIPVNIFLKKREDGKYELLADNFMPRRCTAQSDCYHAISDSLKDLQELIKKHVLPLYQTALMKVSYMAEKGEGSLYYWEAD